MPVSTEISQLKCELLVFLGQGRLECQALCKYFSFSICKSNYSELLTVLELQFKESAVERQLPPSNLLTKCRRLTVSDQHTPTSFPMHTGS